MAAKVALLFLTLCAAFLATGSADPDLLQDVCVADFASGQLDVGFITTANVLIPKTIKAGEIFTFPKGLVHFQKNNGQVPAAVIAAFGSQLAGTQTIGATLFAAQPPVPDNVLTKAFQVGTKEVQKIKSRFAPKK
ncbi:hypothetical protein D5086_023939 [Populus alba]|uniref:Uncharacterized protein n=1 Tax=Populus alba TaxID=43335 RepID=A0ACC4B4Q6_POPAL